MPMKNKMKEKVQKIIDKVRPYVNMHGGDVYLVGIKDEVVTLKITGTCQNCSLANLTYDKMLGGIIREEIPEIKDIIVEN